MPIIELKIEIKSNIETCFDLSRSIDFHQISTAGTNEKAIGGRTKGLINFGETVTWEATHFGIRQKLTSIVHDHYFEQANDRVIMKDVFSFQSPFGILGKVFDKLILKNYLKKFLVERNNLIKEYSETTKWKTVITNNR